MRKRDDIMPDEGWGNEDAVRERLEWQRRALAEAAERKAKKKQLLEDAKIRWVKEIEAMRPDGWSFVTGRPNGRRKTIKFVFNAVIGVHASSDSNSQTGGFNDYKYRPDGRTGGKAKAEFFTRKLSWPKAGEYYSDATPTVDIWTTNTFGKNSDWANNVTEFERDISAGSIYRVKVGDFRNYCVIFYRFSGGDN